MTENMKLFLEKVSADETQIEKFATLDKEALIALAREMGIDLTEADFTAPEGELAEAELDAVVGGYQRCICVVGGGGKADSEGAACMCIYGGTGLDRQHDSCRCFCPALGTGYEGGDY